MLLPAPLQLRQLLGQQRCRYRYAAAQRLPACLLLPRKLQCHGPALLQGVHVGSPNAQGLAKARTAGQSQTFGCFSLARHLALCLLVTQGPRMYTCRVLSLLRS